MAALSTNSICSNNLEGEVTMRDDGYCYINDLKVTGVGWLIRDGDTDANICVENRVALTKDEQREIGDSQPFMLKDSTSSRDGSIFTDVYLAKTYMDKMVAKGKDIKLTKPVSDWRNPNNIMSVLRQIVEDAKQRNKDFHDRHFIMALLREGIKQGEVPFKALKRGISEECKKKFHGSIEFIPHKFVYERRGNTCLLVYFVDIDMLVNDVEAVSKAGECNYFCAKSLPGAVNNDYLETRQHEMLTNAEVEKRLIDFQEKYGENGIGCDLKYWGGLKMWMECKKYF